jgi:vancomycin resistance protein YoaR
MSKAKIFIFTILTVFLLLPPVLILSFEIAFKGKIYPGVKIVGLNVGGMDRVEVRKLLENKISSWEGKVALVFNNKTWEIKQDDLGIKLDIDSSINKAWGWGRSGSLAQRLREKLLLLSSPPDFSLEFFVDEAKYDQAIGNIVLQIEKKHIPYSLAFQGERIVLVEGSLGREVRKKELEGLIISRVSRLSSNQVAIPVKMIGRRPSGEEMANLLKRGERMRGKSLIISGNNLSLVVGDKQLVQFLAIDSGYQEDKLDSFIRSLKETVNRKPQDALFTFSEGRVKVFSPAKNGYQLNSKETAFLLVSEIRKIEDGKKTGLVVLPIQTLPPSVTTADSNQFGISGLIGKGESYFKHSAASRIANIKLAAGRLNGLLIKPGEEFSFNKSLGEVSRKTGYKQAYVIQNGRTVLGDGGGVCQVSTTLFRAILNAGLPIIERHAHSYRVSYYEQNSFPGLDATVFAPSVDLRFKNDFSCWLLIQSKVSEKEQKLEFSLFACPDGREVKMGKPKVWDVTPPPPDLYIDDPALPLGVVKQIDFKSWGAKASFDWKVVRNGEILYQRSFYSNYRPWRAVFLRGTALAQ